MFDLLESGLVLSLALSVMFAVGLDLDFGKLLSSLSLSVPLVKGLAINLLLLPLLTVGWVMLFELSVAGSIGLLLCALCAGGSTGLLFSLHGNGDRNFSLSLFIVLNALSLVLVPIYLVFMANYFFPQSSEYDPLALLSAASLSILLFQLLPLLVGVGVRRVYFNVAMKLYPLSKKIADVSLVSLFVGFAVAKAELLLEMPLSLILALVAAVVCSVLVSVLIESAASDKGRSVLFLTLVRNLTLALLVSDRIFGDPEITLVILAYGLFMYCVCGLLVGLQRRVGVL